MKTKPKTCALSIPDAPQARFDAPRPLRLDSLCTTSKMIARCTLPPAMNPCSPDLNLRQPPAEESPPWDPHDFHNCISELASVRPRVFDLNQLTRVVESLIELHTEIELGVILRKLRTAASWEPAAPGISAGQTYGLQVVNCTPSSPGANRDPRSDLVFIAPHCSMDAEPPPSSPLLAVLDCAEQSSNKKNSSRSASRWNFGLCATIPRQPRQARKGATVTGSLRVPRSTRSSSDCSPGQGSRKPIDDL